MNIKEKFEKAKREVEQEKKQTYGIYLNKRAIKKAVEDLGIKPKELITKVIKDWLIEKGYLEKSQKK